MASPLTPRATDFPRWYQDVITQAELADNGPVRGTMVIRPWGYAIWERMQAELDARIKEAGAENAYFPLFIPESYLQREAEHVEGFSPELAVVTHGGGKQLDEPVVVRPTSETVINSFFAKWVQSYRDLPLLINQWANVVRWELRPRLFLRTSEFLWQEGHTAHATEAEARHYALRDPARRLSRDHGRRAGRAGPGRPQDGPGAVRRRHPDLDLEAMMGDGKALQMGTSHELGQNFAKAFGIQFSSDTGAQEYVWQTSWGASTRLVGALIMAHGDDAGLRLPPRLAPVQVVVLLVRDEEGTRRAAEALVDELRAAGHRVRLDDRVGTSFGRRSVDWELKGVPVRVEVGPRDLALGQVTVVRRDRHEKRQRAPRRAWRPRWPATWRPPSWPSTTRPCAARPTHPAGRHRRRGRRGRIGRLRGAALGGGGSRWRSRSGGGGIQRPLPPGAGRIAGRRTTDISGVLAVVAKAY